MARFIGDVTDLARAQSREFRNVFANTARRFNEVTDTVQKNLLDQNLPPEKKWPSGARQRGLPPAGTGRSSDKKHVNRTGPPCTFMEELFMAHYRYARTDALPAGKGVPRSTGL